ncbi:hypothetical protein MMC28_001083 [Mycoblastus sanguinarius]|nr:hypothetical protein [Mycoblastus sanguinarius]
MSQYGAQQQYGAPQGQYNQQAPPQQQSQGYDQQDPSQQNPSQYGQQQNSFGQDAQEDPSQQDNSQYGGPQGQSNGYQAQPSQAPKTPDQAMTKQAPKNVAAQQHHPSGKENQKPKAPRKKTTKKHEKNYHNTLYHQSQAAKLGFTKAHMESFIHLGNYALGALSNQHEIAPDAPHPGSDAEEEEEEEQ